MIPNSFCRCRICQKYRSLNGILYFQVDRCAWCLSEQLKWISRKENSKSFFFAKYMNLLVLDIQIILYVFLRSMLCLKVCMSIFFEVLFPFFSFFWGLLNIFHWTQSFFFVFFLEKLFPLLQLMEVWDGEWGGGQEEVLNVRPVLHTRNTFCKTLKYFL